MLQYLPNHRRVLDSGNNPDRPLALFTSAYVDIKRTLQPLGPSHGGVTFGGSSVIVTGLRAISSFASPGGVTSARCLLLYPRMDTFHAWLQAQRQKVPDGPATARATDYSLKGWRALTRYIEDGAVPIDNNWVENQIRPWALAVLCGCLLGRCAVVSVSLLSWA